MRDAAEGAMRRVADPLWRATAVAGLAQLAALTVALAGPGRGLLAASLACAGLVVAAFVLVPQAARALRRHPGAATAFALLVLLMLWLLVARTGEASRVVTTIPGLGPLWSLGSRLLAPALISLAAIGGVVLIADGLRLRMGPHRPPWRQITDGPAAPAPFPWRTVAGVLLVGWAAFFGLSFLGRYTDGSRVLEMLLLLGAAAAVAIAIGTPLLVSSMARRDRVNAAGSLDDERRRFAAHLHDSVLQTLALVQRQANDPVAVARAARRQEHALRAWMAGETELLSETLSAALRDVVDEVEDEHAITVEVSVIGDRPLDPAGSALVAAAREALRNAARHAPRAPVFVFAEISGTAAEVFVRDEGPGFDPDAVPTERRGIRDSIAGRMAAAGGGATIDSAPGRGTEVALRV
jgi:signal transduction histidine kinase